MTAPISATPWDLAAGNKWSIDSENHDFAGDSGNEVIVDANGSVVAYVSGGMENGNGALLAAAPALRDALKEYVELSDVSLDSLERLASEFYCDTGYLAPGKDIPPAIDSDAYRAERQQRWNKWAKGKHDTRLAWARVALKQAGAL